MSLLEAQIQAHVLKRTEQTHRAAEHNGDYEQSCALCLSLRRSYFAANAIAKHSCSYCGAIAGEACAPDCSSYFTEFGPLPSKES